MAGRKKSAAAKKAEAVKKEQKEEENKAASDKEDQKVEEEAKEDEKAEKAEKEEDKSPGKPKEDNKTDEKPKEEAKDDDDPKDEPQEKEAPTPAISKKEEVDPSKPLPRDLCFGDEKNLGTMMFLDLVRLYYVLLKHERGKVPTTRKGVEDVAERLTRLMLDGKFLELSGLKDVPKPFLKGPGRIFEKKDSEWTQVVSVAQVKTLIAKAILDEFKLITVEETPMDLQICVKILYENLDPSKKTPDEPPYHSSPRPCDVLFLPVDYPIEENMPYEHQSGNKHLLFLASQHVSGETKDSYKRVEAAFKLVTSKVEVNSGTELIYKNPRYVVQSLVNNQNSWREMNRTELAEFACIFVFEVYLEKQIHGIGMPALGNLVAEQSGPGTVPVEDPTPYDVLFGRGGMTNGHPGNRRFRDVIALHRPDYIRATKMDKPNVARRIVRAIRHGDPPGRFLKKNDDGKWYDVGDRTAAEKTSQGLRERSNAEKRQRSALREALRIRREDVSDEGSPSKKQKTAAAAPAVGAGGTISSYIANATIKYAEGIPLSLSMKEKPKEAKGKKPKKGNKEEVAGEGESTSESLPPNAVDKDGNILVTDYDILCGRGGLTNHHKGNKRFRDIVALHRPDYVRAPKIQKPSVARVIVRAIRNGEPPGRFLRKDDKSGKWVDIGDKKAAEKTSQALREKTGDEKDDEKKPAPPFNSPTLVLPNPATAGGIVKKDDSKKKDRKGAETAKSKSKEDSKEDGERKADSKNGKDATPMDVDGGEKKGDSGEVKKEAVEHTVEV